MEHLTGQDSRPLDRRAVIRRLGGDLELLIAIVDTFLARFPRHLEELESAVRSGDAAALSRSAHALKGSVANFTLGPVYQLSSRLEEIGKSGELSDDGARSEAETLVASLVTVAGDLETELRAIADDARSGQVLEDV